VIQARKDSFFFALFRDGGRLTEDAEGTVGQISGVIGEKTTITGPAAIGLYNALPSDIRNYHAVSADNSGYAKELIRIARDKKLFYNDNTVFINSGPEYIRKTDAELNLLRN
jgi:tRNA A37 threonylcarbamoyladenosine modification protein TsaB